MNCQKSVNFSWNLEKSIAFLGTKRVLREMVELFEWSLSNQIFLEEDFKRLSKIQTKLVLQIGTFDDEDELKVNLPANIREKELSKEEWKALYRSTLFFTEIDPVKPIDPNIQISKLIPEKAENPVLIVKFNFYFGFHETFGPKDCDLLTKCNNKIIDLTTKVNDLSSRCSELNSQSNELSKQLEGRIEVIGLNILSFFQLRIIFTASSTPKKKQKYRLIP